MAINWGDHWGDASHHDIVHTAAEGELLGDKHDEAVSDQ